MGHRYKLMALLVCVIAILILSSAVMHLKARSNDYVDILTDAFDDNQDIQVSEIFDFDFERAYVFNDCYISGDGFASAYGLDLSISEVRPGTSENIHRIVFVDRNGNLVYEFQYDINQVNFLNEGTIIYPNTRMIKCEPRIAEAITLFFASTEFYSD